MLNFYCDRIDFIDFSVEFRKLSTKCGLKPNKKKYYLSNRNLTLYEGYCLYVCGVATKHDCLVVSLCGPFYLKFYFHLTVNYQ